jgi:hypothetical protein
MTKFALADEGGLVARIAQQGEIAVEPYGSRRV